MSAEMITTADGGCPTGESGPVQDVPGGSPVEAPNHAAFSVGFPDAIPWLSVGRRAPVPMPLPFELPWATTSYGIPLLRWTLCWPARGLADGLFMGCIDDRACCSRPHDTTLVVRLQVHLSL